MLDDLRPLVAGARDLGVELAPEQLERFGAYLRELLDWNQRVNLTAIVDPVEVQVKHFADSLACLSALPPDASATRLVDVGSGAGLPGVALKIARPGLQLTLLEATRKKAAFLEHLVGALGLAGVAVLAARAEELGQVASERESYDVATARAVAELATLAELCLPLLRVGGRLIAQKKAGVTEELRAAGRAISVLGGRLRPVQPYRLPGLADERWLVVVDKVRATPAQYPRRPGLPAKRPL